MVDFNIFIGNTQLEIFCNKVSPILVAGTRIHQCINSAKTLNNQLSTLDKLVCMATTLHLQLSCWLFPSVENKTQIHVHRLNAHRCCYHCFVKTWYFLLDGKENRVCPNFCFYFYSAENHHLYYLLVF